jgi:hypothetical protein
MVGWVTYVAYMEWVRYVYKMLVENLKGRDYSKD